MFQAIDRICRLYKNDKRWTVGWTGGFLLTFTMLVTWVGTMIVTGKLHNTLGWLCIVALAIWLVPFLFVPGVRDIIRVFTKNESK